MRFLSVLTTLRTLAIDVVVVAFIGGILWATVSDISGDQIVIEEILLPEQLTKLGYSGPVASLRLWDAMQRIVEETAEATDFRARTPLGTVADQLEITEPESGLSLRGLSQLIRKVLGFEQDRIAGEFICWDLDCSTQIALRLRVFKDGRIDRIEEPPIGNIQSEKDINKYFDRAALATMRVVDPMVAAEYMNLKGDAEAAAKVAEAVVSAGGEHQGRAATLLVQIYAYSGNLDEALRWRERIPKFSHMNESHWEGVASTILGWVYMRIDDEKAKGHFRDAIEILKRSQEVRPKDPLILLWLGNALMGVKDYEQALNTFESLAQLEPNRPEGFMSSGWALYNLKNREHDAVENYEHALMVSRLKENIHIDWALDLYEKGHYEEAIDHFRDAIKQDPEIAEPFFGLWISYLQLDNVEAAAENFRTYLAKDKRNGDWTFNDFWDMALKTVMSERGEEPCNGLNTLSDEIKLAPESERESIRKAFDNYVFTQWAQCPS